MKKQEIQVENLKCTGCVTSVTKNLSAIEGVDSVQVILETGTVVVLGDAEITQIESNLVKMGYPKVGDNTIVKKAQSFVSCAIGKFS